MIWCHWYLTLWVIFLVPSTCDLCLYVISLVLLYQININSIHRSVLPWAVLPVRGTLCLPALLLPFSPAPMTSSAWQPSLKAASICVAPTAACPPVSRLPLMSRAHHFPVHTPYPPTPSQNPLLLPPSLKPDISQHFLRPHPLYSFFGMNIYIYI